MGVTFISIDPVATLNEIVTDFESANNVTLSPASPEYNFCAAMAYRIVLQNERFNAAINGMLIQFSTAPLLDYLVALLGVTRLPAAYAVCTLQFTLIAGHGPVVIPQNTRVISKDGQFTFATVADCSIDANTNVVNVDAECQVAGAAANNYAIGTISQIQDIQAYLSSCSNIDVTSGGSDAETDSQLQARAQLAPASFSVAGPSAAYKAMAMSASPLIVDVAVQSQDDDPTIPAGQINLYPLLAGGQLANDALLAEILSVCSAQTKRPLDDQVVVLNPAQVN